MLSLKVNLRERNIYYLLRKEINEQGIWSILIKVLLEGAEDG